MDKHYAYTMASSTLNVALLASLGLDNRVLLQAVYNPTPLYALTPFQIVEAMFTEHGVLAGSDLSRLRAPLQEPLSAVADLERHMNKFLLASKKLTVSGQGKTDYEYFELFLETVQGFPIVSECMSTYYAVQPTVQQQNIDTLFPYLKSQHPYMLRTAGASPFSGAVTPAPAPGRHRNKKQPKWGPNGAQQSGKHRGNFAGGAQGPHGLSAEANSLQNQVLNLTALLAQANVNVAAMMGENLGASAAAAGYSVPTVPSAYFGTQRRPFYCFVHGSNTSHNGAQCKVMAQNPLYTADMKAATSPASGGNPNVGPPVPRSMLHVFTPPIVCSPCALSSTTQARANKRSPPDDENVSAGLATRADAPTIRGHNRLSRTRVDELMLPARVLTHVSVSPPLEPVVSMPLPVPVLSLPKIKAPKQVKAKQQARVMPRDAKSVQWATPLIPTLTPSPQQIVLPSLAVSQFAHPNPFAALQSESSDSEDDDEDDPPSYLRDEADLPLTTPQAFIVSPLSSASLTSAVPACLSMLSLASPIIYSGCTGILVQ